LKESIEQFQLWLETQQQVIQDETEQLEQLSEQLSKEIQENERKAEELKKDELKTQKKLSPKNERKDKACYIRPDSMFEGVSHIVSQYCGRRKIGYFDRSRVGISKQKKFFWNEEDQEYYTPSSLLAKLTEEVKGKTVRLNCWIADYILVVFADSTQMHLADLDLLHSLKKETSLVRPTYLSY
jgi:hypothetical protein